MTYAEMLEALKTLTLTERLALMEAVCCTLRVKSCNSVHNSYWLNTREPQGWLPLHKP